ncbi:hypothetical protein H0H92_002412 [Tricholoma furcatifolium]|nr:hypothetical protein H0H92_002412 [Tricholoma furcatifolium]
MASQSSSGGPPHATLQVANSESTPLLHSTHRIDDALPTTPRHHTALYTPRIRLLEHSLTLVPVISIGHLSTTALAAVSLGTMTANVTGLSILQGLASGLDTVLPSAYTSERPEVGVWAQRMGERVSLVSPLYFIWFNAESLLLALKQDPEVASLAALYLRCYSLCLPAIAFNSISRRYFQSQGLFYIQTRIICIAAPVNILLTYLLVWGPDPIRIGFIGAPIASSLSTWLISLVAFIHGAYLVPKTAWHPLSMSMFSNLGLLVRLGLSGIAQMASEWWAWELVALAASFFGPTALAAQSILLNTAATVFQLGFAISSATNVRIGNLLGQRNASRAEVAARTLLVVALGSSCLTSTVLFTSRNSLAKLFNNDEAVAELVKKVLPLIALYQVVEGNSLVTGAILRARGKQFVGAVLNLTAYYVIDWNEEVIKVEKRLAVEERLHKVPDGVDEEV